MIQYDKKALKRHMVARGLDHIETAVRAQMTRQNIDYISKGMTVPKATTLAKIANALDVPIESFFRSVMQQKQRQPGEEHHGN